MVSMEAVFTKPVVVAAAAAKLRKHVTVATSIRGHYPVLQLAAEI